MASEAEAAVCGFRRKRVISTNARGHNNHCKPEKKSATTTTTTCTSCCTCSSTTTEDVDFRSPRSQLFLDLVLVVVQLLQRALKFEKSCDKVEKVVILLDGF